MMNFDTAGQDKPDTSSGLAAPRRGFMFDLRTGKPFEIPERDQFGRCRFVTEFEKLNRVGEGTYGIVYRARDQGYLFVIFLSFSGQLKIRS